MKKSFGTTCCCNSRIPAITGAWVASLAVAGCIVIPTPTMPAHDIPADQREALRAERATRVDILLRFGEPELRLDGDRVLVYRWNRTRAVLLLLNSAVPVEDVEAVFLEFGEDGRLSRTGTATAWQKGTVTEQAEAWSRGQESPAP